MKPMLRRKLPAMAAALPVKAKPRAVLACVGGQIVGDCVVVVSEDDPNWWRSMAVRENGKITLRGGLRWR
jgi:hypothetical protein